MRVEGLRIEGVGLRDSGFGFSGEGSESIAAAAALLASKPNNPEWDNP